MISMDVNSNYYILKDNIYDGDIEYVRLLLNNEFDVNYRPDEDHFFLLHVAISYGCNEIVQMLLDKGANVNLCDRSWSPLHEACRSGHLEIVKVLVQSGAVIDAIYLSETPLQEASQRRYYDIVWFLKKKGAAMKDVSQVTKETIRRFDELERWEAIPTALQELIVQLAAHHK